MGRTELTTTKPVRSGNCVRASRSRPPSIGSIARIPGQLIPWTRHESCGPEVSGPTALRSGWVVARRDRSTTWTPTTTQTSRRVRRGEYGLRLVGRLW